MTYKRPPLPGARFGSWELYLTMSSSILRVFFPVCYCSPAAAVAFKVRNKPSLPPVSHPSPVPGFLGERDLSLAAIISINHVFRSPSSFTNVPLSADASPCFSTVGFSWNTAQQKELENKAVLTPKFPFLSNRACRSF